MGKFSGKAARFKRLPHPMLNRSITVPFKYQFYGNGAEKTKYRKTCDWVRIIQEIERPSPERNLVIDAFAGAGVLALIYLDYGYQVLAIEKDPILAHALLRNIAEAGLSIGRSGVCSSDNMVVLEKLDTGDPRVVLIDLDTYSSCVPQIQQAARILKNGFLFVTCGDIMAGARFGNWGFVKKRYGVGFTGPYQDYPVKVIYPFIQKEFGHFGKETRLHDSFSFLTICRLCVRVVP